MHKPVQEDISSVHMIQNENQLPSADEWVKHPVDTHDTKNSIDNPQDIINNDDIVESDKSEIKKDILSNNENEDTNNRMIFKVVPYPYD